jgi:hypothetical protein
MKSKFWLIAGLALGVTLGGVRPAHALLPSDIDGDTRLTDTDTRMILQAVLGLVQLTPDQFDAADLYPTPGVGSKAGQEHGDGKLNVLDVIGSLRQRLNPPSPLEPTFANVQREIFNKSCAFSSCHGATGHRGNMILTEGQAYEQIVNVKCSIDEGKTVQRYRIAPGDPNNSMMYIKLTHPGPDEGDKMPQGTETGLDPSKIDLLRRWILRGAPKDGDLTPLPTPDNTNIPIDPNFDVNGDVQLAPPPPGEGIQMEIQPFIVPQGTEIQRNYYMKFPSDVDVDIQKMEFAFNPGSHHLNIFKSDSEDLPEGSFTETYDAVAWEKWYLVVDSQNGSLGWKLPEGVAIHLNAHQQLNLQIHYVNVDAQRTRNGRGKVLVNWWFAKPGTVKSTMGAMFAQNRTINLPPHAFSTYTKTVKFPYDVTVLAMTGHFHSRGKEFIVNQWDGTNVNNEVYRSLAWGDPPFKIYDQPFGIKAGEGLSYTTTYFNDTDKPIKFGAHVDTEEHSNLFVFFYPAPPDGKALYDF